MNSLNTTPVNLQEEYTKTEIAKILNILDEERITRLLQQCNDRIVL